MSSSIPMSDPEELLAHSSWVHALAVSLVHDVSMADDVVQDTWVAALKRPPRTKKVRSWLAAVVMNSVRQRHRARNRREKREKLFAPSEHLASTEEIVEIESERRRVVDAVLLLHEPYRSTVLLRYWSDLSADEIAHREGVPSSTIRNRLRRALLRVRAELDRGGREKTARALQALVIFAPAGTLTGKASLSGAASLPVIGALMMNAKLIVAAAFVILSVLGWQVLVADGSRPGIEADTRARPVIASTERTSHRTTRAMPTRESLEFKSTLPVSEPSRVDALPDANDPMTAGRSLFGSVMDESGRPVVGAQVRLRINSADEESTRVKASGEYWLTGLPSGEGDLLASAIGFQTVRVSVDLAAGGTRADLVLRPEIEIGVKFLTDDGEPLFETMKEEKTTSSLLRNALFVIATETEPPKTIGETCPSDRFGCGVYRAERPRNPEQPDGFVVCDREPPLFLSAVLGNVVLRTKEVVADTDKVEFWISPADIEALGSTIQFRVVEKATNRPMQKHVAVAVASTAMVCIGKEPDAHGTYVLDGEVFGRVGLWVRARGYQPYFQYLQVGRGETVDLGEIGLEPSVAINGRVLFEPASNAGAWLHEYSLDTLKADDPMLMNAVFNDTESDGSFRIDGWKGRLLLVARPKNQGFGFAAVVVDTSDGPVQGVEIPIRSATNVTIRPRFEVGTTVRLLNDQGLPLWARLVTGEPRDVSLSDGTYTVEAWRGGDLIDREEFEVDGMPIDVEVVE